MAKQPVLTPDEEIALARRVRAGDKAARNELVERNAPYVNRLMGHYAYLCKDDDLRQQMFLGLLEAADVYDPDTFHTKFLTIAQHYVKKYVRLYLSHRNLIFVPPNMRKPAQADGKRTGRAKARYDMMVTAAECAQHRPLYLGAYPHDADEIVGAEPEQEPGPSTSDEVLAALAKLSPLEEAIVCGRFGIGCSRETTKSLAQRFDLHPQKLTRIRDAAMRKLHGLLGDRRAG